MGLGEREGEREGRERIGNREGKARRRQVSEPRVQVSRDRCQANDQAGPGLGQEAADPPTLAQEGLSSEYVPFAGEENIY